MHMTQNNKVKGNKTNDNQQKSSHRYYYYN